MEQRPAQESAEFNFKPTTKVIGFIDEASEVKAALAGLGEVGFKGDEIEVLTNDEGAGKIDATAGELSVAVHRLRSTLAPDFYDAPGLRQRVEQQLLAGHFGIAVLAREAKERERVREILLSHHGYFINFYGEWAAQALEP